MRSVGIAVKMRLLPGRAKAFKTARKQGCDCVACSRKRRTGFISRQGGYENSRTSFHTGLMGAGVDCPIYYIQREFWYSDISHETHYPTQRTSKNRIRHRRCGLIAEHFTGFVEKANAFSRGRSINTRLSIQLKAKASIFRGLFSLLFLCMRPFGTRLLQMLICSFYILCFVT